MDDARITRYGTALLVAMIVGFLCGGLVTGCHHYRELEAETAWRHQVRLYADGVPVFLAGEAGSAALADWIHAADFPGTNLDHARHLLERYSREGAPSGAVRVRPGQWLVFFESTMAVPRDVLFMQIQGPGPGQGTTGRVLRRDLTRDLADPQPTRPEAAR